MKQSTPLVVGLLLAVLTTLGPALAAGAAPASDRERAAAREMDTGDEDGGASRLTPPPWPGGLGVHGAS